LHFYCLVAFSHFFYYIKQARFFEDGMIIMKDLYAKDVVLKEERESSESESEIESLGSDN